MYFVQLRIAPQNPKTPCHSGLFLAFRLSYRFLAASCKALVGSSIVALVALCNSFSSEASSSSYCIIKPAAFAVGFRMNFAFFSESILSFGSLKKTFFLAEGFSVSFSSVALTLPVWGLSFSLCFAKSTGFLTRVSMLGRILSYLALSGLLMKSQRPGLQCLISLMWCVGLCLMLCYPKKMKTTRMKSLFPSSCL